MLREHHDHEECQCLMGSCGFAMNYLFLFSQEDDFLLRSVIDFAAMIFSRIVLQSDRVRENYERQTINDLNGRQTF